MQLFGTHAFTFAKDGRSRFNAAVFDAQMAACGKLPAARFETLVAKKDAVREAYHALEKNGDYARSVTLATSDKAALQGRISRDSAENRMNYRRTRAWRKFETQLDDAVRELRPLYNYVVKGGGGGGSRLLAAYYVFAFTQLEVHIKSFVEDFLNAFSMASPSFDKWPDTMMAYLLHKSENLGGEYRRFGIDDDEGAILTKVAQTARKVAVWGGGGATPTAVQAPAFLEKKKYPSPKNLPQLFRRLGVPQIWAVVSRAGRLNSELIPTSLNDLRTGIAHEGRVPTGFGLIDFLDRIGHMRRFVAALDRGMTTHFCPGVMPRAAWNGAMAQRQSSRPAACGPEGCRVGDKRAMDR